MREKEKVRVPKRCSNDLLLKLKLKLLKTS